MKINLFLLSCLLVGTISAQTITEITTQKKNVVLEEFTGKTCLYCPDGHKRADDFAKSNLNRVVLINVHAGSYSNGIPNYRTYIGSKDYGQDLYRYPGVGLKGFPAGTVNRRLFSGYSQGTGTAQSRGSWSKTGTIVLNENSPVNVTIHPYLDIPNGKIEIYVEAYFTSGQSVSSNRIHVGVMQNNVLGPQSGGSRFYTARWNSTTNQYRHMHMLRAIVTPQWGDIISNVSSGQVFQKTYTWQIPSAIGSVSVVPADLEFYVFISEDQQKIITGVVKEVSSVKLDYAPTKVSITNPTPSSPNRIKHSEPITELEVAIKNNGPYTLQKGAKIPVTVSIDGNAKSGSITLASAIGSNMTGTEKITDLSLLGSVPASLGKFDICVTLNVAGDLDASNNKICESYTSFKDPVISKLEIFDFNPKSGRAGTEVWIDGTGFDSVASRNVIKFNGTVVTQILANSAPGQLKVLVPTGASTGKIVVEALGDKDTSTQVFTILAPVGIGNHEAQVANIYYFDGILSVELKLEPSTRIGMQIWNMSGQKVQEAHIQDVSTKIDVGGLPPGSYVANLGTQTFRFTK